MCETSRPHREWHLVLLACQLGSDRLFINYQLCSILLKARCLKLVTSMGVWVTIIILYSFLGLIHNYVGFKAKEPLVQRMWLTNCCSRLCLHTTRYFPYFFLFFLCWYCTLSFISQLTWVKDFTTIRSASWGNLREITTWASSPTAWLKTTAACLGVGT